MNTVQHITRMFNFTFTLPYNLTVVSNLSNNFDAFSKFQYFQYVHQEHAII